MDRSRLFMLLAVLLFVGLVGAYFGPVNREQFSSLAAVAKAVDQNKKK